jgi:hypothetical protein
MTVPLVCSSADLFGYEGGFLSQSQITYNFLCSLISIEPTFSDYSPDISSDASQIWKLLLAQ